MERLRSFGSFVLGHFGMVEVTWFSAEETGIPKREGRLIRSPLIVVRERA
jgi:hypothetical protein